MYVCMCCNVLITDDLCVESNMFFIGLSCYSGTVMFWVLLGLYVECLKQGCVDCFYAKAWMCQKPKHHGSFLY